jgi:hypothetical protein
VIPRDRRLPRLALLGAAVLVAGAATAAALEEPAPKARLDEMDMAVLQRSLLKIYVCGKESTIHERKLDELRLATQTSGDPNRPSINAPTPEELKTIVEREKFIHNYLLAEKTNAVQIVHIIDRILGVDERPAGETPEIRAILERKLELFALPKGPKGKGIEIREAGKLLSEAIGCPVRVETIDTELYYLTVTMERTTAEAVIKQFCSQQPKFDWRFDGGTLVFRHRDLGKPDAGRGLGGGGGGGKEELDDEEKKAEEEERRKKRGEK